MLISDNSGNTGNGGNNGSGGNDTTDKDETPPITNPTKPTIKNEASIPTSGNYYFSNTSSIREEGNFAKKYMKELYLQIKNLMKNYHNDLKMLKIKD